MSFRRAHSNFVNLGRLYSIPPWGTVLPHGLVQPQNNFVNLGNLYARSKFKYPAGWAYFDDGSVFILPFAWFSHDAFEARMKVAAQFVTSPTPKMQEVRKENPHRKRFIVINKDGRELRGNTFRILARNAQDGQRVSVAKPPFENVELSLDPTGSRPISARFNDAPQLKYEHRLRNTDALETFRGTLVNGILQPNVRLGNGLRLSNKPEILKPQITEKRRTRNHDSARSRESARLPPKASVKSFDRLGLPSTRHPSLPTRSVRPASPPQRSRDDDHDHGLERREAQIAQRERELIQLQQQLLLQTLRSQNNPSPRDQDHVTSEHRSHESAGMRADTTPYFKAAEIEVREWALEQREELWRYKRKTWLLEQKLAQATARSPPRRSFRKREADVQEQDVPTHYRPERDHESISDPPHNGSGGEQAGDYSLHNPSPPDALADLRSRIQLPTRNTIRSTREPK